MRISAVNSLDITARSGESGTTVAETAARIAVDSTTGDEKDTERRVAAAVEKLNTMAAQTDRQIRFSFYKDTHRIMLQVVDSETNKVLSTFPPTQILEMAASLESDGKLLDKKI